MLLLFISSYVATTVSGLVVLKMSAKRGKIFLKFRNGKLIYTITPLIGFGIGLYVVSFFLYVYLVSKYDLGYIIPLAAALVYVTLFTVSYYVLDEEFTKRKIIALAMMIMGILLLGVHGT